MIRGHLKIIVLSLLNKGKKTGYTLMDEVEKITGQRPSPGSIYPLMDSLVKENFVDIKEEGRKKIYIITPKGKKESRHLKKQKDKIVKKMSGVANILDEVCKIHQNKFFGAMLNEVRAGKFPLVHLDPEISEFRDSLVPFFDKNHKNIKKLRKLLVRTTKEINKLQ